MKFKTPITLAALAEKFSLPYRGNPNTMLTGINEIHMVEAGDITFVDHPKYYTKALNSAATLVIIDKEEVDIPEGKCILICASPFDVYNKICLEHTPFLPQRSAIHETAEIHPTAIIMPGVFIGPRVHIGKNSRIHPNVCILSDTYIGDDVVVQANTTLGSDAFYYKKKTEGFERMHSCGRLIIHNRAEIGANCAIDKGVSGDTIIGEGTKLDNHVHIGHDTHIGKNCLLAAQVGVAGVVVIEDEVILWGKVGVQKDLTIGKGAVILGDSAVSKSLKGGITYWGSPAEEARGKWRELALLRQLPEIISKLPK